MSENQTSITIRVDLSRVHELRSDEKSYAILANQHDEVEVYVVRRSVRSDGEVVVEVDAFSVNGDILALKVEGDRD